MVRGDKASLKTMPSKNGATQSLLTGNIQVVVRVRPPNQREMCLSSRKIIDVVDDNMLVFDPKEEIEPFFYQGVQQQSRNFLKRANKELKFAFDRVFGEETTNNEVFEGTIKEILPAVMEGFNCSVFVYGATGAGKTFTMLGNKEHPGITYLTMEHFFSTIESFEHERIFDIGVSYIEVYNEHVYDLLEPTKVSLNLREDAKYGVTVAGLSIHGIKTARELLDMLENGNRNRTQHPTDANAESSRSHAVFQVYLKMRYKLSGEVRMVKLSMIDLAGSERASATGSVGDRFKEGANINRSLLSLGNCINMLSDGSKYIPYRDSKLTRLLKDSLGGNCRTVMVANISPSSLSYEDTYNTLKYAARANKIQLSMKKNVVDADIRVSQYVEIIAELKNELKECKSKLIQATIKRENTAQSDENKCTAKQTWKQRLDEEVKVVVHLEEELLTLMSRQRVLSLQYRMRVEALEHLNDLSGTSANDSIIQMCNENIPKQERAAETCRFQSDNIVKKISCILQELSVKKTELNNFITKAINACPDLDDYVQNIKLQSEVRQVKAENNLRLTMLQMEHNAFKLNSTNMGKLCNILKDLFIEVVLAKRDTPQLTNQYVEVIKQTKFTKSVYWLGEQVDDGEISDINFKSISNLDMDKPAVMPLLVDKKKDNNLDATVDVVRDSDDLTDVDLNPHHGIKRKMPNVNDTIIIDDSYTDMVLDETKTIITPLKKIRPEVQKIAEDTKEIILENGCIDPMSLNSTFVLALNNDKDIKIPKKDILKKVLSDRTNTIQRNIVSDKAKVTKPVIGKAAPFRRLLTTGSKSTAPQQARPAFGSSLPRNGQQFQKNIQVRARERVQNHPYTRPTAPSTRR